MFRQTLRRCLPLHRAVVPSPVALSRCTSFPAVSRSATQLRHALPILNSSVRIARFQSTNAGAAVEDVAQESPATGAGEVKERRMKFEDLKDLGVHQNLIDSLTKGFGYETMTEVQEKTIRAALQGKDLVAQAKTGTGKTLAFLLPMLQRMIDEDPTLSNVRTLRTAKPDDIRGIVLSPTRELAEQISVEARKLCKGTGLVVQLAVGGRDKQAMLRQTRRQGCHLLIATPGRLNDLLWDERSCIRAPKLTSLVLDEADRMLDVGFAQSLATIQEALPDIKEKERQTMLFSATIPSNVVQLARSMVRHDQFEFVQTIRPDDQLTHERVPQQICVANGWANVFPTLYEYLDREMEAAAAEGGKPFKAIVYFQTTVFVELAENLDSTLNKMRSSRRVPVYSIHGQRTQNERTHAANSFRRSSQAILFSSDVTARGMDFPDVTHVIQVGLPQSSESYIHRVGRTGRQEKEGQGWLLIPHTELDEARKRLAGLPISRDTSLECPGADIQGDESKLPSQFVDISRAFSSLSRQQLEKCYELCISISPSQETIDQMNIWAKKGWGFPETPRVTQHFVTRRGLSRFRGLHIADGPQRSSRRRDDDFDDFSQSQPRERSFDSYFESNSDNNSRGRPSRGGFSRGGQSRGGYSRGGYSRDGFSRDGRSGGSRPRRPQSSF